MVHIIFNEKKQPIGWEMKPITEEEQLIAARVRDMQFFGMDDTYPEYNGLQLIEPSKGKKVGNIKSISWLQKKYHK